MTTVNFYCYFSCMRRRGIKRKMGKYWKMEEKIRRNFVNLEIFATTNQVGNLMEIMLIPLALDSKV